MDGRCPNCGHELVLFVEWQDDVLRCPSCPYSSAIANNLTRWQYQQTVMRGVDPRRRSAGLSPARDSRARSSRWLGRLGPLIVVLFLVAHVALPQQLLHRLSTGLVLGLGFGVFVLIIALAVVWKLVPPMLRTRSVTKSLHSEPNAIKPSDVGTLAMLTLGSSPVWARVRNRTVRAALDGFVAVAPRVSEEEAAKLGVVELASVILMLLPDAFRRRQPNWEAARAACQVLGKTRCANALWPLGRLAADGIQDLTVPRELREEAANAADAIRGRVLQAAQETTLLRASSPASDTASLLRPAAPSDDPAEQLLRRHEDHGTSEL